jgi:hemerythrin
MEIKMRVVEWEDMYCLGIEHIDRHHQFLIELLNKSYNAIISKSDANEMSEIFRELSEYAEYHFEAEEEMMAQAGYNGIKLHLLEHETFKEKLTELQGSLNSSGMDQYNDIIFFLEKWLLSHILVFDKNYVKFINVQNNG